MLALWLCVILGLVTAYLQVYYPWMPRPFSLNNPSLFCGATDTPAPWPSGEVCPSKLRAIMMPLLLEIHRGEFESLQEILVENWCQIKITLPLTFFLKFTRRRVQNIFWNSHKPMKIKLLIMVTNSNLFMFLEQEHEPYTFSHVI